MMFLSYTILFLVEIDLEVLHLMGPVKFALTGMI